MLGLSKSTLLSGLLPVFATFVGIVFAVSSLPLIFSRLIYWDFSSCKCSKYKVISCEKSSYMFINFYHFIYRIKKRRFTNICKKVNHHDTKIQGICNGLMDCIFATKILRNPKNTQVASYTAFSYNIRISLIKTVSARQDNFKLYLCLMIICFVLK